MNLRGHQARSSIAENRCFLADSSDAICSNSADFESLLPVFYLLQIRMFTGCLAIAEARSVWFGEGVCRSNGHEMGTLNGPASRNILFIRCNEIRLAFTISQAARLHGPSKHSGFCR